MLSPLKKASILEYFRFIGRFLAKSMMDSRLIDMELNPTFLKLLCGREVSIEDMYIIDEAVARFLCEIQRIVKSKERLIALGKPIIRTDPELCFENVPLSDMVLGFHLPSHEHLLLPSSKTNEILSIDNIEIYYEEVLSLFFGDGMFPICAAFLSGYNEVANFSYLSVFSEEEINRLISGYWVPIGEADLLSSIQCDHGYTIESPTVQYLISVLVGFDENQQKAFLKFVTGCPRLSPGGFAGINPPLTVVKKIVHSASADDFLPSVSTCTNYLKIPEYSSIKVLREKLILAIEEGQKNFSLS